MCGMQYEKSELHMSGSVWHANADLDGEIQKMTSAVRGVSCKSGANSESQRCQAAKFHCVYEIGM